MSGGIGLLDGRPTNASWLNRIEAQFTALRSVTLDGTDHGSHPEQASRIRRYIAWRNRHARDQRLGSIVKRATLPDTALSVSGEGYLVGRPVGSKRPSRRPGGSTP